MKTQELKEQKLWTISDVANYLDISKSYVYKLVMEKALPYYKPRGGRVYFDRAEVEAYVKSTRVTPNAEVRESVAIKSIVGGRRYGNLQ